MSSNNKKCPHCGHKIHSLEASHNLGVSLQKIDGRGGMMDKRLFNSLVGGAMLAAVVGQVVYIVDGAGVAVQLGLLAGSVASLGLWLLDADGRGDIQLPIKPIIADSNTKPIDSRGGAGSAVMGHRVEVAIKREGQGGKWAFLDLPVTTNTMILIARSVLMQGGAFSRPWLCNHRGLLTQTEYHNLRRILLKFQMLEAHGKQTKPTTVGRAFLRYYAGLNMRNDIQSIT